MCDPVSAVVGISAGVGLFGSIKSGKAAKKSGAQQQANYNKVADARIAKIAFDIDTATRSFKRERGTSLSAIGTTGISRASFYDVLADSASEFKLTKDALTYSGIQESEQLRAQGAIAFQAGKDQASASYIQGASNIIGAAAGIKLGSPFQSGWQTTTTNASGQVI